MPNYHAVTLERHASQRWLRTSGYAFAAQEAVVPLVAIELPRAMLSLPIAFTPQTNGYLPTAILGLQPGKNLFLAQNGEWTVGYYIPSALRSYPFRLARTETGQLVLCIDEDSDTVCDGPGGNRFFDDNGQAAIATRDVLNHLKRMEQSHQAAIAACAALQKHQLIKPWPVSTKTEADEKPVTGLFQIDEEALNKLPGAALQELAQCGALVVAYCQLLSMQHLPKLKQMAEAAAARDALALTANGVPNAEFFSQNGTISFAGF